mmetsp:Transcript_107644/g.343566  ORF Transcript_107644/g.343566 Transcript_107644/m.343566 type:complete len:212 (+) Transcript_107644:430-1065(+)
MPHHGFLGESHRALRAIASLALHVVGPEHTGGQGADALRLQQLVVNVSPHTIFDPAAHVKQAQVFGLGLVAKPTASHHRALHAAGVYEGLEAGGAGAHQGGHGLDACERHSSLGAEALQQLHGRAERAGLHEGRCQLRARVRVRARLGEGQPALRGLGARDGGVRDEALRDEAELDDLVLHQQGDEAKHCGVPGRVSQKCALEDLGQVRAL